MKKLLLSLLFVMTIHFAHAQWTPGTPTGTYYLTSGSVGIGIQNPTDQLEVVSGNRKVGFNTIIPGVTQGGALSISRSSDGTKRMFFGLTASPNLDPVLYGDGGSSEMRLVSGGLSSLGFGFYTNISNTVAFGNARPTPVFKIDATGKIGINNASPNFLIDLTSTTDYQGIQLYQTGGKWVRLYSASLQGGSFNNITGNGDTGIVFGNSAGIGTVDNGFVIAPHRADRSGLRVTPLGNVAIGVNDTNGYRLAVGGKMVAEEVVVKLQANWPDFVFEKDYKLPTLSEVGKFIKMNKHLPGVPSAAEINKDGIAVGDMNAILMKKIEELTLYLLEMEKKNQEQDRVINELLKK